MVMAINVVDDFGQKANSMKKVKNQPKTGTQGRNMCWAISTLVLKQTKSVQNRSPLLTALLQAE